MKRFLIQLLAVVALVFGGLALAAPATAAPVQPQSPTIRCVCDAPGKVDLTAFSKYLAAERWRDATTQFHGRFDEFLQSDLINQADRGFFQGTIMSSGNMAYSMGEGVIQLALNMTPIDALGEQMDHIAATVGGTLFSNGGAAAGVVVGIVVWVVAVSLFQMRRGQKPWRKLIGVGVIVAFISIMIAGGNASTTTADGKFKPGFMSPGWFATKIDDTISTVASFPATGLLALQDGSTSSVAPAGTNCYPVLHNMSMWYGMAQGGSASVPRILSGLWEDTGLTVWKEAQYGVRPITDTSVAPKYLGTTYGDNVFCHQLDWQAGLDVETQMTVMFGSVDAAKKAGFTKDSYAWGPAAGVYDNDVQDKSLVAWAACRVNGDGTFSSDPGWAVKIQPGSCAKWATGDKDLTDFNVGGSSTEATNQFTDPAVVNFLHTLHGNDIVIGTVVGYVYAISAWMVAVVFAGLGLAIAVAKFAALVMMVALIFVLIASLISNQERGGRIVPFAKTYIGFAVLAFGANFLLALIATLSHAFTQLGHQAFSDGTNDIMAIFWTGFSPLLAVILLHLVFTKVLKVPGFLKPSSAFAWGSMAGSVGASAAHGFARRAEGRAGRAAATGVKKIGKIAWGGLTKRGTGADAAMKMTPKGGNGGGTGTNGKGPRGNGTGPNGTGPKANSAKARRAADEGMYADLDNAMKAGSMNDWNIRDIKFDPKLARDARAFARGYKREGKLGFAADTALYRAKNVAQGVGGAGQATGRATVAAVRRSQAMLKYMNETDARVAAKQVAGAAMNATKSSWTKSKTVAAAWKEEPKVMASRTFEGAMTGAKATARVVNSPAFRAAAPVAVGMAVAGPVGAVAGGIFGARAMQRRMSRDSTRVRASEIISYVDHQTAPRS